MRYLVDSMLQRDTSSYLIARDIIKSVRRCIVTDIGQATGSRIGSSIDVESVSASRIGAGS
jgi:hypothetical protein